MPRARKKTRIIQIRIDEELDDVVEYLKSQPGGLSWWIRDKLRELKNSKKDR